MRAGDLLGAPVADEDGMKLGVVQDIRLRRERGQGIVIAGLIVGRGTVAARLGYAYGDLAGPWLLARLSRRAARRSVYVPWERLERRSEGSFSVLGGTGDLHHPARQSETT